MQVVLLTPEYPPAPGMGGIGTNTATLATGLARLGHRVTVVVSGATSGRSQDAGVEVINVGHRWIPIPPAQLVVTAARLARVVRAQRPDVVHAAEWGALAWAVVRLTRLPVVTRLATPTHVVEELNEGQHRPATAQLRAMERAQTVGSAAIYAPSKAIAMRVGHDWDLNGDQIPVMPNSIDVAAVRRHAHRTPTTPLPARFVAFIGRLERRKGLDQLGPAVAAALAAHPDLHVVLVGRDPGDEGGAVLARFLAATSAVHARVHLVGELARDEALAVVARAELVLLPSLWESFGYVCVEALALGRPVIAADTGGFAEIIRHGIDGWLVPPGDADALARELLVRLADPESARKAASEGRRTADRFDSRVVTAAVANLLQQTADGSTFSASVYRSDYRRYFYPEEHHDPFRRIYRRKRALVTGYFAGRQPGAVLDAGGGFGRLTGPLSARHRMTLCDLSESMLFEARRRLPADVGLVQADVRALPFARGRFDAALALDVLCHVPDAAVALGELMRVVRDDGEVIFDTTNARPAWVLAYPRYVSWRPRRLLRTLRGRGVLPEWRSVVRHHTPAQVRQAAAAAGVRVDLLAGIGPPGMVKWHVWRGTRANR